METPRSNRGDAVDIVRQIMTGPEEVGAFFVAFFEAHAQCTNIVDMGKEGRTLTGTWGYLNRKLPFIELP